MDNNEIIKYHYKFKFDNGIEKEFEVRLNNETLNLVCERRAEYPQWTQLKQFKCPNCPLDETQVKYCPVITNLIDVIGYFKDSISYEEADIMVETSQRSYMKRTSLQNGLNSLVGIYMVTSGCPVFEKLKPMVRFHLPFATLDETNFRMMSMYLFAQYFIYNGGGEPDWQLNSLVNIYDDIRIINKNFCHKLSELKIEDAAINALVTLDCFAFSVSYTIDNDKLEKMKRLFKGYL
jgi:hypothetical protein